MNSDAFNRRWLSFLGVRGLMGVFFAVGVLVIPVRAAESWSDPRLNVTNQLAAWFDVSRQNAARGAEGMTPLRSWQDAPDILLDGSGRKRHLRQPILAARPKSRFSPEV